MYTTHGHHIPGTAAETDEPVITTICLGIGKCPVCTYQANLFTNNKETEMTDIAFDRYIRTPFAVEASKITEENIEEVAKLVGEVKTKGDEKYIALDRRIVPNVGRAYIGWYLTRLGDNLRCYSPKVFKEQFEPMPENAQATYSFLGDDEDGPELIPTPIQLPVN